MKELKKEIKEHWIRIIITVIILLIASGLVAQGIDLIKSGPEILAGTINKADIFSFNPLIAIKTSLTTVKGIISLLVVIGISWMGYFYGIKPRIKEKTGYEDARNFTIADEGTYGTSSLMKEDEITKILDMEDGVKKEGNILGKYNDKVLTLPSKKEFEEKTKRNNWKIEDIVNNTLNHNQAIIGAPGTSKSRAFARNLIFQTMAREESLIITDPKGELFEDTEKLLKKRGYKVKVLNLVNPRVSDSWDCIKTIGNDSIVAKIFADTVANNAGAGNDKYWVDNASIIFKAVSMYVIESGDEPIKTMGRVYDILASSKVEDLKGKFETLPPTSVARRAYNSFERCNDNVKGQILNGISTMLSVFQDDTIRNLTNTDEINLEEACYEKCAYFLIMSDQHKSFDFLAVLFYAMSFVKQVEAIDRERSNKASNLKSRKTIPITYLMDEFSNLGQIPDFTKKIATVRSRDISIIIIIQSIPQLKNRYPNDQWEEILGCCDTTIFLGCTDPMTAKYICERTGIATIEVESINSTYDRQIVVLNQETEYHEVKSRGQRKVMNEDEVLRMKNTDELVFLRCQKPLLCQKFDYTLHPYAKLIEKSSLSDHLPEWKRVMKEEEEERGKKIKEIKEAAEKEAEKELEEAKKNKHQIIKITKSEKEKPASTGTCKDKGIIYQKKDEVLEKKSNDFLSQVSGMVEAEEKAEEVEPEEEEYEEDGSRYENIA